MKKKLLIIILILTTLIIINIYKNNFTNSILIITQDNSTKKIEYWEINDRKNSRQANKFKSDNIEILTPTKCYKHYFDQTTKTSIDETDFTNCLILDSNHNELKLTEEIKNILNNTLDLEHSIISSETKIITLEEQYYVTVALNVNIWSPYTLYKYNKENNTLKEIYTFDNKNIIGLKLK